MILKLKRTPGIYLVGFMGCGKTVVGRRLAERLGWTFTDIDAEVEASQRMTISEIFEKLGETEFRRLETEAIRNLVHSIQRGMPTVVGLGGGAFTHPGNYEVLENNGVTIWLDAPLEVVRRRIAGAKHRPLARDPIRFEVLYYARRDGYRQADYRIEVTSDDPEVAVDSIRKLPIF